MELSKEAYICGCLTSILLDFIFIHRGDIIVYNTGSLMSGAVLCSVQIHQIVPGQVTLTRTDVLRVHPSTISADKDLSPKDMNVGPGSDGRKVRGRRVQLKEYLPVNQL